MKASLDSAGQNSLKILFYRVLIVVQVELNRVEFLLCRNNSAGKERGKIFTLQKLKYNTVNYRNLHFTYQIIEGEITYVNI